MNDTELLQWIANQGNGDLWIARQSLTGRGFRLHNITQEGYDSMEWGPKPDADIRKAILNAMEYYKARLDTEETDENEDEEE